MSIACALSLAAFRGYTTDAAGVGWLGTVPNSNCRGALRAPDGGFGDSPHVEIRTRDRGAVLRL